MITQNLFLTAIYVHKIIVDRMKVELLGAGPNVLAQLEKRAIMYNKSETHRSKIRGGIV